MNVPMTAGACPWPVDSLRQLTEGMDLAKRRRTEITIQTREVVIVRHQPNARNAWCPRCRAERTFVLPEEAARIADVSVRTIFRRIEDDRLHYIESAEGVVRVCQDSISRNVRTLSGGTKQ